MKVKSLRSILVVAALSFSVTASDDPMAPSFELGDISIPLLPAGSGKFALSGNWCPWFLPDLEGIAIYPSVILVPSCGDDTFNKIQMLQSLRAGIKQQIRELEIMLMLPKWIHQNME